VATASDKLRPAAALVSTLLTYLSGFSLTTNFTLSLAYFCHILKTGVEFTSISGNNPRLYSLLSAEWKHWGCKTESFNFLAALTHTRNALPAERDFAHSCQNSSAGGQKWMPAHAGG
jgi:hypothetical protein